MQTETTTHCNQSGISLKESYTISQVACLTGVNAKAIRYYEDIGLLPRPPRGANRYRRYSMADVKTIVTIQIESTRALENLDDILSLPGIDVAFIGPNDLHAQLGLTASSEGAEPEFVDALERIKAGARKHHVALGIFSSDGEAAAERVRQGFQMISVTTDISSMIAAAARNLRMARG